MGSTYDMKVVKLSVYVIFCTYGPMSGGDASCSLSALAHAACIVLYAYASVRPSLPGGVKRCASSPSVVTYKLTVLLFELLST